MNASFKINGRNCREMAEEIARLVGKSARVNVYAWVMSFDMDDAVELQMVTEDAAKYWRSVGKRAKAVAADTIREKVSECIISERCALSFAK